MEGGKLIGPEVSGRQGVLQVGGGVGDLIGAVHQLPGQRGKQRRIEVLADGRVVPRLVLGEAFPDHSREVQAAKAGVGVFQVVHDPKRLAVVLEPAVVGHQFVEHGFAAVPERRVAEIVPKGNRLDEVLVEPEGPAERPGNLGHLQGVRQPGAEVVMLVGHEHLGLEVQPAKGGAVDYPVPVALEA